MNYVTDSLQMETSHLPCGSSARSILYSRSWTGGRRKKNVKEGRQTIFFTPLDPFNSDANEAESITDIKKPRKVHYLIHWRSRIWADRFQCHYYVLFARQFALREQPKVSLRPSWVYARSKNASMPREIESKLRTWSFKPNSSRSRNWPKEEFEQSIDLRVDGIPNDETKKDEQYMQRIAEQVPKLATMERILKDDWPKDNKLSGKASKKYEAGNRELHEVQQKTNKVYCQRCYSCIEAGFQMCPCGRKSNMSEEVLSRMRQNLKQLIADVYMTFQGTREAKHGVQPWQKNYFFARGFMSKINKKGIDTLQASYNMTGQKNGANIWTTSEQSIFRTVPLQNNWNDTLRWVIFGTIHNKWRKEL